MAQFASDAFTTGSEQALEAYSASWAKVGSDGSSSVSATYDRVYYSTTGGSRYTYNATPASADYSVSVDVYVASTLSSSAAGPMIRASATGPNFYMARTVQGTGYQLFKCVSGSYTQLGSTSAATFTAGSTYNLKIEAIGTAIKLYINGSGTATISATDSAISAANKPGIYKYEASAGSDSTGHHIDNFSADQTSAGTTVSPSVGNYTYTGNISAISQPRTVAPSSGAYTVAGNTPTISQPRTLAPAVGAYAYLGNTPEVSQIAGIRPTSGGYVYTGNTPTISQPRTIAPLEGSYAYAGNTPTVSQSAGVSLSPEDLAAIADAVWSSADAVSAHAKLDAILARLTC